MEPLLVLLVLGISTVLIKRMDLRPREPRVVSEEEWPLVQERIRTLAPIAAYLGGNHDSTHTAKGTRAGVAVVVAWTPDRTGATIEARCSKQHPLYLHVRARGRFARAAADHLHRGGGGFEARFVVAGAPGAVLRKLLDAPTCAQLARGDGTLRVADGRVSYVLRSLRGDAAQLLEDVQMIATLASRIGDAYAEALAEARPAAEGGPYRAMPRVDSTSDAESPFAEELARWRARRR